MLHSNYCGHPLPQVFHQWPVNHLHGERFAMLESVCRWRFGIRLLHGFHSKARFIQIETKIRGKYQHIWLVTSLPDTDKYPANEVAGLYPKRWGIDDDLPGNVV